MNRDEIDFEGEKGLKSASVMRLALEVGRLMQGKLGETRYVRGLADYVGKLAREVEDGGYMKEFQDYPSGLTSEGRSVLVALENFPKYGHVSKSRQIPVVMKI